MGCLNAEPWSPYLPSPSFEEASVCVYLCVYVCVCVCVREGGGGREREREINTEREIEDTEGKRNTQKDSVRVSKWVST